MPAYSSWWLQVAFWAKSASVYANNSNVIAYELINEPWAGDVYAVRSGAAPVTV